MLATLALMGAFGLLLFGGSAGQDPGDVRSNRTGLIPLTQEEAAELLVTKPRITKVNLNWLGFERVNKVRSAKGLAALDPASIRPVGREVESAILEPGVSVQAYVGDAEIAANLPVFVDNSKLKYFPPIRNQNPLGSCAAFSTTYTQFSYMTAFQKDLDITSPTDNTNKYSPKWTYNMVNGGTDSGSSFNTIYPVLEKHGAATWAEFPYDSDYKAWCLVPSAWRNALYVRSNPAQLVFQASSDTGLAYLKELLNNGYVLIFGTFITSWQEKTILDDPTTPDDAPELGKSIGYWINGEEGSHAMTVVGYNDAIWTDVNGNGLIDAGEKGGFRIANSWGPAWGDGGFVWLAYDALKAVSAVPGGPSAGRGPAFQNNIVWVLTARDLYSPLMIAEFTVNHAKRNQLKMTLGRSSTSATIPTTAWTPAALQNQGANFAFDGTTTAVDGGFVLDFSDILIEGAGALRYYLGMADNFTGDVATLRTFKLVDLTTVPATETVYPAVPQTADNQQAYGYVDYVYTGPAYDHPPVLSNPQVNPAVGAIGDTFGFLVYYNDQDGDTPSIKDVYIDGGAHAMSLMSGSVSSGWYSYDTALAAGSHSHYFSFRDSRGSTARDPIAGTFSGPEVFALLLSLLSPSSATAGGPGFTLNVTGSDLVDGAVVRWDGGDRPTTFVSGSAVTASIGAADLATGKVVQVTVRNPDGGISSPLEFTVSNPVPSLASFSPAHVPGGGGGFALTLTGSDFVSGSAVRWNGVPKATTFIGPAEVRAAITSADIAASGEFGVAVFNPAPGGGASSTLMFPVSGFTVASTTATATVTAGQPATYDIQVTPQLGSFDAAVTLSCPTLPRGVTASFAPASVTPGVAAATSQLTLTTKASQGAGAGTASASSGAGPLGLALIVAASVLLAWLAARRLVPQRLVRRLLAAGAAICLVVIISRCSAGDGGGSTNTATPPGTYQVGVRGASGGLIFSTTVELIVR
jgi:hypothetical protein